MVETHPTVAPIRAKIAALQAERRALDRAPKAVADIRRDAEAAVLRYVGGGFLDLPAPHAGADLASDLSLLTKLFIATVGPDAVVDTIVRDRVQRIESSGKEPGPTAPERKTAIRKIDAKLAQLGASEERAILDAEEGGITILRRRDADWRVIFGVWVERFGPAFIEDSP